MISDGAAVQPPQLYLGDHNQQLERQPTTKTVKTIKSNDDYDHDDGSDVDNTLSRDQLRQSASEKRPPPTAEHHPQPPATHNPAGRTASRAQGMVRKERARRGA